MLLKEINHRVKNNLQIVSSLLNLQSRNVDDPAALEVLRGSQDRIRSMALIHEKLYQSEDLSRIDLGEYIRSLTVSLCQSYGLGPDNIKLDIDVGHTLLGMDKAVPCGLIVNELVSNCLKHAFPSGGAGQIRVTFRSVDGQHVLIVQDDGVGIPEELDVRGTKSLGLQLVNALAGQLGGTVDFDHRNGTTVKVTFPASKPEGDIL